MAIRFTCEGGREIYVNGRPLFRVDTENNDPTVVGPAAMDDLTKLIARMLNKSNAAKSIVNRATRRRRLREQR